MNIDINYNPIAFPIVLMLFIVFLTITVVYITYWIIYNTVRHTKGEKILWFQLLIFLIPTLITIILYTYINTLYSKRELCRSLSLHGYYVLNEKLNHFSPPCKINTYKFDSENAKIYQSIIAGNILYIQEVSYRDGGFYVNALKDSQQTK